MQFGGRLVDRISKGDDGLIKRSTAQLLSLYNDPPQEELSLDEFELVALDRLQLLRGIEQLKTRGFVGSDYDSRLTKLETRLMPLRRHGNEVSSDQRKDQVSHFILRLAYCRTEDLRNWYRTHECDLLRYRLDKLSDSDRSQFMVANGLDYELVGSEERSRLKMQLMGSCGVTNEGTLLATDYYKVPFQQALTLISSRAVFLHKGYAYVPLQKLVSIIVTRFRISLSKALAEASGMFDIVSGDTRIGPLLKNMNKQYVGNDFAKAQTTDKLTPEKVDIAADTNMPLCMKNLQTNLKRDHKLKHWGRLQYGLFLKGAGLSAEDALIFWELHFSKIMARDAFTKSYAYSFRHMYGKEGSRKNYTPFSCMKIIMGAAPETGAYHGCPYRHIGDTQLTALLGSLKIGGPEVKEIVATAKSSNYQVACQRHFDVTHPGHQQMSELAGEGVANHPNQWYQASVKYHKIKNGVSLTSDPNVVLPNPNVPNVGVTSVKEEPGGGSSSTHVSTSVEVEDVKIDMQAADS